MFLDVGIGGWRGLSHCLVQSVSIGLVDWTF